MENIHVTFCHSAAAGLKQALNRMGNKEQVLNCWGEYQTGPLTLPVEGRISWLCAHYYDAERDHELAHEYADRHAAFRQACMRDDVTKTIWYSRACAKDLCGYLEFLHHAQGRAEFIRVVELSTALPQENARAALSAGSSPPDYLVRALPASSVLTDETVQHDLACWDSLRGEDGDLRVLTADGLKSADISFFDEAMLDHITNDFQPATRIVGNTLGFVDGRRDLFQGNSDLFYFSRLKELFRQGRLDWRGSQETMRDSAIRLAA